MTPDLKARIQEAVKSAEGWCSEEKALAMAGLILALRPQVIVELGVFGGRSLVPMALALQHLGQGIVYGVDPWHKESCLEGKNAPENDEWWQQVDLEQIYRGCEALVNRYGVREHCKILRMTSEQAAKYLPASSKLDLLHCDSNHSTEVSCREIETWLPRLKIGGVWIADDMNWPTMQPAKQMLMERLEWIGGVEHSWHFLKA